jgi:hypothetical protein
MAVSVFRGMSATLWQDSLGCAAGTVSAHLLVLYNYLIIIEDNRKRHDK